MAKFNVEYVKKNPIMFGAIFIVFGLFLWLYLNRGGSSGGTSVVSTGPSDAAISAGTAVQLAQIQAGAQGQLAGAQIAAIGAQMEGQYAIATLEAQYGLAELAASERISDKTLEASLAALQAQLGAQVGMAESNNQFMVDYARVAADSATTQLFIGASLQRDLGAQQLDAYKTGIAASVQQAALALIPSLKKKNRDETLQILGGAAMGATPGYSNTPNGTWVFGPQTSPTASPFKPLPGTGGSFIPGTGQ